MPKISVIIATHSRPRLLPRSIESAFKAGTDVEVIVVDDASTDETAEVCKAIAGIKYIRVERNQRVAGARNIGILASTGDYVSFLDDDDLRLPGTLDVQTRVLDENPEVGLVYGQVYIGDEDCVPLNVPPQPEKCPQGDVFWLLVSRNFIYCQSAVFRRSSIFKIGLIDKNLPGIDDKDFWVRIAELYQVRAVEQPVAIWRKATGSSNQGSSDIAKLLKLENYAYLHKWSLLPRMKKASAEERKQNRHNFLQSLADGLIWNAAEKLEEGQYRATIRYLFHSLCYSPARTLHPKSALFLLKSLRSSKSEAPAQVKN